MTTTYANLKSLGWSDAEAKRRAYIIDSSAAAAKSQAQGWGLIPGDNVAVSYSSASHHDGSPREGHVDSEGRLTVGGVMPAAGMVRDILSRPYRHVSGVARPNAFGPSVGDTIAVLADGTEVKLGVQDMGIHQVEANGKTYRSIIAAAIEITPAR